MGGGGRYSAPFPAPSLVLVRLGGELLQLLRHQNRIFTGINSLRIISGRVVKASDFQWRKKRYTDKKEKKIFLINKEIPMGSVGCTVICEEGLPIILGNAQIFSHI